MPLRVWATIVSPVLDVILPPSLMHCIIHHLCMIAYSSAITLTFSNQDLMEEARWLSVSLVHPHVLRLPSDACGLFKHHYRCSIPIAELPTSTFLPYFVRFLKENTAVRFFLQKYVVVFFCFFFFFFFFFILVLKFTRIIYVMKTWSEFLNNNVQK